MQRGEPGVAPCRDWTGMRAGSYARVRACAAEGPHNTREREREREREHYTWHCVQERTYACTRMPTSLGMPSLRLMSC
jgi:hypothetical protein